MKSSKFKYSLQVLIPSTLVAFGLICFAQNANAEVTCQNKKAKIKVFAKRVSCPKKWRPVIKNGSDGVQGTVGPQGEMGPQGPVGPQGAKGDTGDQGPIGPRGLQGLQGLPGAQGAKGNTGDTGAQGPAGVIDPRTCRRVTSGDVSLATASSVSGLKSVAASCNVQTEYMVSYGYDIAGNTSNARILRNRIDFTTNGTAEYAIGATVGLDSATATNGTLNVTAMCCTHNIPASNPNCGGDGLNEACQEQTPLS